MWEMAQLEKDKTIFFYVGFYNGMSYFNLDRVKNTISDGSSSSSQVDTFDSATVCQDLPSITNSADYCRCVYPGDTFNGAPWDGRCRPWYMRAMQDRTGVVLGDPYPENNAPQDGSPTLIYITFSKYLSLDGKDAVVALDLNLGWP